MFKERSRDGRGRKSPLTFASMSADDWGPLREREIKQQTMERSVDGLQDDNLFSVAGRVSEKEKALLWHLSISLNLLQKEIIVTHVQTRDRQF